MRLNIQSHSIKIDKRIGSIIFLFAVIIQSVNSANKRTTTATSFLKNFGIGLGHITPDSMRWKSLNFGILAATDTLNGFQLGGISSITERKLKGCLVWQHY